jgi:uncharacterized protein involved in tolerance to divalent cations
MTAIYVWEGKRQRGSEAAMLDQDARRLAPRVIAEARKPAPLQQPGFAGPAVEGGSEDFLRWIAEQTAA